MRYHCCRMVLIFLSIIIGSFANSIEYNSDVVSQVIIKTDSTSCGQALAFPRDSGSIVTGIKVVIPSGKETGWHKHPFSGFAYIMKGTLTVEIEGGKTITFPAGSSFAEVVDLMHNGKNLGKEPVELIAFFTSNKNKSITIRK